MSDRDIYRSHMSRACDDSRELMFNANVYPAGGTPALLVVVRHNRLLQLLLTCNVAVVSISGRDIDVFSDCTQPKTLT